tara:strand:- start:13338 stop:14753 length:1416 start_codon:yes stop_codon:yes gene_type:complete
MSNIFSQMLQKYSNDPAGWVRDMVGIDVDPWQASVMDQVAHRTRQIAVRSGHGVGKTSCASWTALWFLFHHFPCKIVITSPSQKQMDDALMAELKATIRKLPQSLTDLLEVYKERIELIGAPQEAFISCRTARADDQGNQVLAGIHSDHCLIIVDEASACPEAIYESVGSSMTSPHASLVLIGNPTRAQGYFYNCFNRLREDWFNLKVSCFDVRPDRVDLSYAENMAKTYGDTSSVYRVRVLGEFPTSDSDSLIDLGLVESAQVRDVDIHASEPVVMGVDVARFGDDSTAVCLRQGNHILEPIRTWKKLDLMETTGRVMEIWEESRGTEDEIDTIFVDSIGLGSAVVDRLSELGAPVVGINVSESASMGSTCFNLRSELWWRAREWLETKEVKIPEEDEKLAGELVLPKYSHSSSGLIRVESKEAMKRRSGASPDAADAFCLTFSGSAAYGQGKKSRRAEGALQRSIGGIV